MVLVSFTYILGKSRLEYNTKQTLMTLPEKGLSVTRLGHPVYFGQLC